MIKLIDILKEEDSNLTFNGVRYKRTGRTKRLQASDILYSYFDEKKYTHAPEKVTSGYVFLELTDTGMSATSRLGAKGPGEVYVVNNKIGNYWECEELEKA